jgi:hypothetical protein
MQQQEVMVRANAAPSATRIKRDVMCWMLENLTALAIEKGEV